MVLRTGYEHSIVMGLSKYGLSRSIVPFEVGGDYRWEDAARGSARKIKDERIHPGARRLK